MIRAIEARDVPKLREMGFAWPFGSDYLCGVVKTDVNDEPLQCMAAWAKAEVHMGMKSYSTPAVRWEDLRMMHAVMERQLLSHGVSRAWTWFSVPQRFCKRLLHLGWCRSDDSLYYRELR